LIVCGGCALAFSIAVAEFEPARRSAARGSALLATFGGALIATGLIVGDPGIGYPPDAPAVVDHWSLHGTLHDLAGLVAFASIVAATFVFARCVGVDQGDRLWARYSTGTGLAMSAIAATVVGLTLAHGGSSAGLPVGTLQRIAIAAGWGWLALLALRFQRAMWPTIQPRAQVRSLPVPPNRGAAGGMKRPPPEASS